MMQHIFERLLVQPFCVVHRVGIERLNTIKINLFVLAYRFAIGVNIRIAQNSEQPGLDICSRLKTIKEAVGFEQRLLHQILGLAGITCQTQGSAVERIKMLERHSFEFGLLASRLPRLGHAVSLQPPAEAAKRANTTSALRRTCLFASCTTSWSAGM